MISLTKQQFVDNLSAIIEDRDNRRNINHFIEQFASGNVVLEPSASSSQLQALTIELMEDTFEYIAWYLYEATDNVLSANYGDYKIENLSDLYYYIAVIDKSEEEDIAYYIAEQIEELNEVDLTGNDLYMYVCNNYNSLIDRFEKEEIYPNLQIELKYLKHEIEKL